MSTIVRKVNLRDITFLTYKSKPLFGGWAQCCRNNSTCPLSKDKKIIIFK